MFHVFCGNKKAQRTHGLDNCCPRICEHDPRTLQVKKLINVIEF